VYRHVSATWDEPNLEERERVMGFQTSATSHTKVIRLERNAVLGRGMDLNSLTWLLMTCVLFQMYTTPTLIQSVYNSNDATMWHPNQIHLPIFSILHFILSVGGEEVPCNLIQVVYDTPGGTSAFREIITTFYESAQLDSVTQYTKFFKHTFQVHSVCFQLPFCYEELAHQEGERPSHRFAN
jgi:hypothetical protein